MIVPLLLAAIFAELTAADLAALGPEEKGRAAAFEMERRNFDGFGDLTIQEELIIENRYGQKVTRQISVYMLEVPGDGDKVLVVLSGPADVRGTAALVHGHKTTPDDMWVYSPAVERVRRISAENKGGAFMGSDFANEDITHPEPEKFTRYRWLRDEVYEGENCFVVERYPLENSSIYSRQVLWIDHAQFRILKVDFFNKNNEHEKTLHFLGYQKYLENHWRPGELKMVNHFTGTSTRVVFKEWKFRVGLKDSDFTLHGLRIER
ncbi:MAG TPA: outer membrane lipoprotein-sorting protein [Candidatus Acidoferrales bacterium]|nr:outer membrane lipoprotein-sorting protein [Candidatus Acidoferrales bacterium]